MKFACSSCGENIEVGPEWAGKPTNCPHCGAGIQVPDQAEPPSMPPALSAAPAGPENPYQTPQSAAPGRYQMDPVSKAFAEIALQSKASLLWGIVGIFCVGIILGPFAIYRGAKASSLIREFNVGEEYKGMATAGLVCGIVAVAIHLVGIAYVVLNVMANASRY